MKQTKTAKKTEPAKRTKKAETGAGLGARAKPLPGAPSKANLAELRAVLPGLPAETERFLAQVMDVSPFLRGLILDDPDRARRLLAADPLAEVAAVTERAANAWREANQPAVSRALRQARAEIALLVGLGDLGGVLPVGDVTRILSAFAEAAVGTAANFILAAEHEAGRLKLPDPKSPGKDSGWVILAMGKLGAGELNYSSDIDLIVFFERAVAPVAGNVEPAKLFVRMTQQLVKILNEATEDGYVFRVDLRLRPDPGSTAIAISTDAALNYYEGHGQNWERAALIKARPIGADVAAGEGVLRELVPYIWRKYLDYAAIADIHSIKRQIHDHRGHADIAVAGHNLKLGRGGIREIEFFVQTQQLIAGGREPVLRGRGTVAMLATLAEHEWIDGKARDELTAAYEKLRFIEHRLQMVADEQTQTIPEDEEALQNLAHMCGEASADAFAKMLLPILETVRGHYQRLFEAAPSLSADIGSLVFTGDEDDPDTLATLARLGFERPAEVTKTVRAWHFGRYPAMRSAAARERLTEITPALLSALADTANADAAFAAFDRFLARLPAGVQLFALLGSNPGLLDLLATVMGTAPRLAETIVRRAHVLDALIEPAALRGLPDRKLLARRLDAALGEARSYEDVLDRARIFGQEQDFLIGTRLLAVAVTSSAAAKAYSDLAELLVGTLLDRVREEFEANHGVLPKGRMSLLALGKLGGREMSAASDLDLILLYEYAGDSVSSNGRRPLMGSQYYARLTQRLVSALTVPTAEGQLYPVDFRLRPSGNAGPLATRLNAFADYQAKEAWTWEHMALTRARPIAGDADFGEAAAGTVNEVLRRKRDPKKTIADILEMRALVESEKGEGGAWDLKQAPGGQVDIEFVAQALQLLHAAEHPEILNVETEAALNAAMAGGVLSSTDAGVLLPALRLYQSLTQLLRLCLIGPFKPDEAPKGFLDLLARAAGQPDFARLDALIRDTQREVRATFTRILGASKAG